MLVFTGASTLLSACSVSRTARSRWVSRYILRSSSSSSSDINLRVRSASAWRIDLVTWARNHTTSGSQPCAGQTVLLNTNMDQVESSKWRRKGGAQGSFMPYAGTRKQQQATALRYRSLAAKRRHHETYFSSSTSDMVATRASQQQQRGASGVGLFFVPVPSPSPSPSPSPLPGCQQQQRCYATHRPAIGGQRVGGAAVSKK